MNGLQQTSTLYFPLWTDLFNPSTLYNHSWLDSNKQVLYTITHDWTQTNKYFIKSLMTGLKQTSALYYLSRTDSVKLSTLYYLPWKDTEYITLSLMNRLEQIESENFTFFLNFVFITFEGFLFLQFFNICLENVISVASII
jgi:hypothetical protein